MAVEAVPEAVRAIAWKAQTRLCRRYREMMLAGKLKLVVVTAIARELAGFVWAIARVTAGLPAEGAATGNLDVSLGDAGATVTKRRGIGKNATPTGNSQPSVADGQADAPGCPECGGAGAALKNAPQERCAPPSAVASRKSEAILYRDRPRRQGIVRPGRENGAPAEPENKCRGGALTQIARPAKGGRSGGSNHPAGTAEGGTGQGDPRSDFGTRLPLQDRGRPATNHGPAVSNPRITA